MAIIRGYPHAHQKSYIPLQEKNKNYSTHHFYYVDGVWLYNKCSDGFTIQCRNCNVLRTRLFSGSSRLKYRETTLGIVPVPTFAFGRLSLSLSLSLLLMLFFLVVPASSAAVRTSSHSSCSVLLLLLLSSASTSILLWPRWGTKDEKIKDPSSGFLPVVLVSRNYDFHAAPPQCSVTGGHLGT